MVAARARKSAAGYDLTRLLVGSEGTLGIITEMTVRLYGIPETILAAVCPFKTLEGACSTVIQAIQLGLGLARILAAVLGHAAVLEPVPVAGRFARYRVSSVHGQSL